MKWYKAAGKNVVVADGTVVREKGSKSGAKKSAKHLNDLRSAKMQGTWAPPENSYSKYW